MKQSTSLAGSANPHHTAIILDGNGRWATDRGLPRAAGHGHGASAVRRTVEAARKLGLQNLTLYAFSSDNWQRPPREVSALFSLLRSYIADETERLREVGIRMSVIGRRDRLPAALISAIETAEAATLAGREMHLRVAVD